MKNKCYRIVRDNYSGYEVQEKKRILFFTVWIEVNYTNTHPTLEHAKEYIKNGCPKKGDVVWVSENCK